MFNKRLWSMVRGAHRFVFGNVGFQWLSLLANIALTLFIGVFLQQLLAGELTQLSLVQLGLGSALAIAARAACSVMAQRMSLKSSVEAKRVIRQQVYDKLVAIGPSYVESVRTSEAMQVSVEGVEQLEVFFGQYLPQLFYALVAPITLFVCLAPLSLPSAVALIVCVPLIPISIMLVQTIAKRVMGRYLGAYTDLGAMFLENIQGLTTLKIYQADEKRHAQMNEEAEKFRVATMNVLRMQLNSIIVMDVFAYGGAAVGIIVTLVQFVSGNISLAAAFTITLLSAEFFLPMRALGSFFHTAMNGLAAAEKMFKILDAPLPPQGTRTLPQGTPLAVSCTDVAYSYDGERQVLHGVGLEARPGELIAIVGPSGSGKSTLASIVSAHIAGYGGEVRLGGVEVRDLSHDALAGAVTTVSFASYLFKGSVRSNLLMGKPDASDEQLWAALERCRLADFVRASGGLDMALAEQASNLSGGQRQRLCLARALLHDTPVYIFDEATSNVDAESEAAIWSVIEELACEGHTVIAIAHRLAVVRGAARIYALDGGAIVESGTHEKLLAAGGTYARMWGQQAELEAFARVGSDEAIETSVHAQQREAERARREVAAAAQGRVASTVQAQASDPLGHDPVLDGPAHTEEEGERATGATASGNAGGVPGAHRRSALAVMGRLVGLVRPLAPFMVLAVVLGVLGHVAAILLTLLGAQGISLAATQAFVQGGAAGADVPGLMALLVAVGVCGIVRGPLHYGEQLCNHFIAFKLLAHVRDKMFAALRRLAPAKLEGRDKGNLISTLTSDIELLEVFYAHTISPVAIAIVVSLAMTVLIWLQAPQLGQIALLAYVVVGIVVPFFASKATGAAGLTMRNRVGDMNTFVLDGLRGLTETLQYGQAAARSAELAQRAERMAQTESRLKDRTAIFMALTTALIMLFDIAMLIGAALLCLDGVIGFGQAIVAVVALMSSFGPVVAVANLGSTLAQTIASGNRVLDVLDEQPQVLDITNGADVATFTEEAASDVDFTYGGEQVLSGVNLRVTPGTVTCLTGRSGSGKSTLLKLLMRFWDPTGGFIEMSGTNLRRVNTASLRANQSYMTQETHLFAGTIGENILLAQPDATREELERACEKAALLEFVHSLPRGFDTPVGELGSTLSGGERQRIGLARVFLRDAPLVLLDEPTSNLDSLNEATVLRALERERAGKTIVLVSHRRSTVAFADAYVSVEHGRVS